jgi:peptidoglycan/xylan/chitin deacetylase (PgdA/CDA1 family)
MIQQLKTSSLGVLKHLGVSNWVAQSAWRRSRLLILCYHGVSLDDEHLWNPGLYVSARQLEQRLELLRRNHCTVLPLGEAVDRMYRNDLPERAVALTFDDGYYDFMLRAWPLLQAYGYPATVYLTTSRVDHNLPNVGLFTSYALWLARDRVLDGDGIHGLAGRYPLATEEQRAAVVSVVRSGSGKQAGLTKDAVVEAIVRRLGLDYDRMLRARFLTLLRAEEVTRLAGEGVDFQLHTHWHCTPADVDAFIGDVLLNRDRIAAFTGRRPTHLCYPSGNYRMEYLSALHQHGVATATTCDPGMAAFASHPLLLPRFIDTTAVSEIVFEGWLTGIAPFLPRRTRKGGYREVN